MKTVRVSELVGPALDWAVAKCEGVVMRPELRSSAWISYSSDWAQGGPIIEREGIDLTFCGADRWVATHMDWNVEMNGDSPLEAAMRFYVYLKLDDVVDLPEGL